MNWLNYHHLYYFWMVAKEGGLLPASRILRVSHPTLSTQIRALENSMGVPLFSKKGRKLALTENGRLAFRYAEDIFAIGSEMVDTMKGLATNKPLRLDVGIVDAVPKLMVHRILQPTLQMKQPVHLVCQEATFSKLLGDLSQHVYDVVISDAPVPPGASVRAFTHLLGESSISIFGVPKLAAKYRKSFPDSLHGAPFLLPLENLPLRRALNQWFSRINVRPRLAGEFEDSALIQVFGAAGAGLFAAPSVVASEVCRRQSVEIVGHIDEVKERFYAISVERRLTHPAVAHLSDVARTSLFSGEAEMETR